MFETAYKHDLNEYRECGAEKNPRKKPSCIVALPLAIILAESVNDEGCHHEGNKSQMHMNSASDSRYAENVSKKDACASTAQRKLISANAETAFRQPMAVKGV